MPLPENIIILFYWTAPHGISFLYVYKRMNIPKLVQV